MKYRMSLIQLFTYIIVYHQDQKGIECLWSLYFMHWIYYVLFRFTYYVHTTVGHINNNIYILHAIYNYQTG